jgi:hypothetical protein
MNILCALLLASAPASAQLNPSALLSQIQQRGAEAVFRDLWPDNWSALLQGIESGKKEWLRVAVAIHPTTDAGPSEMLFLAGGVALAQAPADVLTIMVPEHPIQGICGFPDMSDERTDTKAEVLAYLKVRSDAVRRLTAKNLQAKRNECLESLAKTEQEVRSPNGPFGK